MSFLGLEKGGQLFLITGERPRHKRRAEFDGQVFEVGPGDTCYFPPDAPHVFTAISDAPLKCLVIYSPPYGESPEKGVAR